MVKELQSSRFLTEYCMFGAVCCVWGVLCCQGEEAAAGYESVGSTTIR